MSAYVTDTHALIWHLTAEDRTRAISEGYQMHLTKPVDAWKFLAYVARLAGRTNPVVR